jgi:hypothetical protein
METCRVREKTPLDRDGGLKDLYALKPAETGF